MREGFDLAGFAAGSLGTASPASALLKLAAGARLMR